MHSPEEWFDTDHQALITSLEIGGITDNKPKTRRKSRKIYNIKQATDQAWNKWKEGTQQTAQRVIEKGPQDNNLNRQWNTIRNIITKAANRHFSLKKVPKNKLHTQEENAKNTRQKRSWPE